MVRRKVVKVFLVSFFISIVFLPLILMRGFIGLGYKFYKADSKTLSGEDGVTSLLILGKGGDGHEAPDLTDTILNIYLSDKTKKISIIPLPRDIWIEETKAKLNSSYYWGKQKTGNGLDLVSRSVMQITGIKPDYVFVVDFNLFKDIINTVGGIDVDVKNSFVDDKFPIKGEENNPCIPCRYKTVSFTKGPQKMDGETALNFVRSRNSTGQEGTDLARESRQQLIVQALKDKLLSKEVYLNLKTLYELKQVLINNVETNINLDQTIVLTRQLFDLKSQIQNLQIPENYLSVSQNQPKYNRLYVFVPKSGSWQELQKWIKSVI